MAEPTAVKFRAFISYSHADTAWAKRLHRGLEGFRIDKDLGEALKAYRDSLAINDRLAKADPSHALWQRDLSISYERVGNAFKAQGNLAEALEAARAILRK